MRTVDKPRGAATFRWGIPASVFLHALLVMAVVLVPIPRGNATGACSPAGGGASRGGAGGALMATHS